MTFLKKLGQILANIAGIAVGIGPIITPFLGSGKAAQAVNTGINDLTAIGTIIVQIETAFAAVPGSTGAQKLQASIPLIGNIIKRIRGINNARHAPADLSLLEMRARYFFFRRRFM